jgi:hypothetical protein
MIRKSDLRTETYPSGLNNVLDISCELKLVKHVQISLNLPSSDELIERASEECKKMILHTLYGEIMQSLEIALLKKTTSISSDSLEATVTGILQKYREEMK